MTHEQFITLKTARLAKQAGFDWAVETFYNAGERVCRSRPYNWNCETGTYQDTSRPTQSVLQKWLREVKNIYVEITLHENKRCVTNSDGWTFHYEYFKPTFDCEIKDERCETIRVFDGAFNTYEEAQEAGLKKALEIILRKDNKNYD